MNSLQKILESPGFKIGIELVSSRGILTQPKTEKLLNFGKDLCEETNLDWVSITDNAGGNPAISPTSIGKMFLDKGKETIIHLTCKDTNRNGLESKAWEYASAGFNNILAITGDYPISGYKGVPKPVFDIDSVGLLHSINQLNEGLEIGRKKKSLLQKTNFYQGAVVSNFKKNENELIPQYLKLVKKIESGASFIINQVGFDAGKMSELIAFQKYKKLENTHFIGNVFVLSKFTVNLFHQNRIPAVILTKALQEKCMKEVASSTDNGKQFFLELAAKMLAIYKGLGYKGGYLGGVHNIKDYQTIMQLFASYKDTDWKQFAQELHYPQENEFFMFTKDSEGLSTENINETLLKKGKKTKHVTFNYALSKKVHDFMFTPNKGMHSFGKKLCEKSNTTYNAPKWLYKIEKIGKKAMFDCQDCGDCSLQEIAFLCPESQCAKNQRNGPCGGTNNTKCEVKDVDCIWARAYDRKKYENDVWSLLNHTPVFQNSQLEGKSSWGNFWLEKDHLANKK